MERPVRQRQTCTAAFTTVWSNMMSCYWAMNEEGKQPVETPPSLPCVVLWVVSCLHHPTSHLLLTKQEGSGKAVETFLLNLIGCFGQVWHEWVLRITKPLWASKKKNTTQQKSAAYARRAVPLWRVCNNAPQCEGPLSWPTLSNSNASQGLQQEVVATQTFSFGNRKSLTSALLQH